MGVIDKTTYKLTCHKCGISETSSVLDKGSGWGGSSWQNGASFSKFRTDWSGGGSEESNLISAICNVCGTNPTVESGYNL